MFAFLETCLVYIYDYIILVNPVLDRGSNIIGQKLLDNVQSVFTEYFVIPISNPSTLQYK